MTSLIHSILSVAALLWAAPAFAQDKAPVVEIPADRFDFKVGDPLSSRALVTRPAAITNVLSWSLETRRHRGGIWCIALSPDGKTLATGGLDGTIRVWDVETGKLIRALIGHNSYVSSLDFSPDGNTLASAGTYDITVRLWDTRSGRPLRILQGHPAETTLVKWSPDGRSILASGGASGVLSSWNAVTGKINGTMKFGEPILSMSWHPDGKSAAIVGQALAVRIWDADKNASIRTMGNATDGMVTVAWNPDGKTLAAGSAKNTFIFDAAGAVVNTVKGANYYVVWLDGGKQIAGLRSKSIAIWDAGTGALKKTVPVVEPQTLAVAPDFATFVVGAASSFAVHDRATAKLVRRFDNLSGTEPPLWWANKVVVTGIGSLKLTQWDADTGKKLRELEGHTGPISAVSVSAATKALATASHDKTVRVWDAAGKPLQTFKDHAAAVLAVAFAPEGKVIASADADKKVLIWEVATGKLLYTLNGSTMNVTALAWKPGSTTILATNGVERTTQIWNVKAAKVEISHKGDFDIVSLAWSPDGTRLALGEDPGDVVIWHIATKKLVHKLKEAGSPPQVTSLAWAPKGTALASGRGNHTMQLWEPKSGAKIFSLPTMAPVQRVSWTAGGTTIGVSSQDRTLRCFDAPSGRLRAVLLAEDDQLLAVNFDGHYRAPASEAELVYVVQTRTSQDTYAPSKFAAKFLLKNAPAKVSLFGN